MGIVKGTPEQFMNAIEERIFELGGNVNVAASLDFDGEYFYADEEEDPSYDFEKEIREGYSDGIEYVRD